MKLFPWHEADLIRLTAQRGRFPHAVLLQSREGSGDLDFAFALSQALLCEALSEPGPGCGSCPACTWFALGNHPDFRVVQPASLSANDDNAEKSSVKKDKPSRQIRIDQVRELQDFLVIGTHRAGRRVIVLHPADTMNGSTQNALLKSLEEPPSATTFILVSSHAHRLLPTVRSRCRIVPLALPARSVALNWLTEQGVEGPEEVLALAGGAPLAAMRVAANQRHQRRLLEHLSGPRLDVLAAVEPCLETEMPEAIGWLQRWTFDLLAVRLGAAPRYHLKAAERMRGIVQSLCAKRLTSYWESLARARALAEHPLNPRLFFEDLLVRYRDSLGGQ